MLRDLPAYKKGKDDEQVQLRMNRTVTVIDERLDRHLSLTKEAQEDAARDRTFEEFKERFLDHLEGKVDSHARTANRPDSADGDGVSRGPKTGQSHNALDDENNEGRPKTISNKYDSIGSRGKGSAAGSSAPAESSKDKAKYDIPNSCKLEMLKLNRIEKLDEDYVLVAHPYPQLEGEMLLFQINTEEQEDKDCILYNDYSLRKRHTTEPKPARMSAYQKK